MSILVMAEGSQKAEEIKVPNLIINGKGKIEHMDADPHGLIEFTSTEAMAQAEIAKYGKP